MPIYQLSEEMVFPHPTLADEDGILAIGGELSIERLLLAYSNGIFPWPYRDYPLLWWSPDPRMVIYPEKFKVSKSLRSTIRNKGFEVHWES